MPIPQQNISPWAGYTPPPDPLGHLDPSLRHMITGGRNIADPFHGLHNKLGISKQSQSVLTPEAEQSALATLGQGAMTGLGTVAGFLDKYTGARAARAAIDTATGGDSAREMLSFLPFSDMLGVTDPTQKVWSKDILQRTGDWEDTKGKIDPVDMAGFGLDVLTDPSFFFGGFLKGGLTKAGSLASKAGVLKDVDHALQAAGMAAGKYAGKTTARKYTTLGDALQGMDDPIRELSLKKLGAAADSPQALQTALQQKVGSSLNFGIPFTKMPGTVNIPGVDRARDAVMGLVRKSPIGTMTQRLFNAPAKEMKNWLAQDIAKNVNHVLESERQFLDELVTAGHKLKSTGELNKVGAQQWYRWLEGFSTPPAEWAPLVDKLRKEVKRVGKFKEDFGSGSLLSDSFIKDFFPRQGIPIPGKFRDRIVGEYQVLDAAGQNVFRADAMRNVRGGTAQLMEIMSDPRVMEIRKGLNLGGNTPKEAMRVFLETNYGNVLPDHVASQNQELLHSLGKLLLKKGDDFDSILSEGFYVHPLEAMRRYNNKYSMREAVARGQIDMVGMGQGLKAKGPMAKFSELFVTKHKGDTGFLPVSAMKAHPKMAGNINPFTTGAYSQYIAKYGDDATKKLLADLGDDWTKAYAKYQQAFMNNPNASRHVLDTVEASGQKLYDKIGDVKVPKALADDVTRWDKTLREPDVIGDVKKWYDGALNMFKAGMLTWPARFTRDAVSGQVMNATQGMFSITAAKDALMFLHGKAFNPKPYLKKLVPSAELASMTEAQALKRLQTHLETMQTISRQEMAFGQVGTAKSANTIDEFVDAIENYKTPNLLSFGFFKDMASRLKKGEGWNPLNIRGVGDRSSSKFMPVVAGEAANQFTDGMNRLVPYLKMLKEGVDPAEISRRVSAAQVSYSRKSLTNFESEIMTRAFPFYRFTRGMTPFVARELMDKPAGPMAQLIRGSSQLAEDEEFVPEYLRSGLAVNLGEGAREHTQRYLTGLGLMHEDVTSLLRPAQTKWKTFANTLAGIGGKLTPFAKFPIEAATGKQMYSGREMTNLDPAVGRMISNMYEQVTGKKINPLNTKGFIDQAIMNSPVARGISTLSGALNPSKGWFPRAVNAFSGVKISDIDMEKHKNIAIREAVMEKLSDHPAVRTLRPHMYVREEDRNRLNPYQLTMLDLYRQQYQRQRQTQARRAALAKMALA